jgi:hypothetical protein
MALSGLSSGMQQAVGINPPLLLKKNSEQNMLYFGLSKMTN